MVAGVLCPDSATARTSSIRNVPSSPPEHYGPAAAIDFYTRTFDVTRRASVAGFDGIRSENMYVLFNQVKSAPPTSPDSAIWHFGWGSTAMEADYQKHLANGIQFHTPITRLGSTLLFAYMKAPGWCTRRDQHVADSRLHPCSLIQ